MTDKSGPPTSANFDNLLTSAGVPTALSSITPSSRLLPVNESVWDVKLRKEYKVGWANGNNVGAGTNVNNDFQMCFNEEVNLLPFVKKELEFNQNSVTVLNDNLYLFFTYNSLDGSIPTNVPCYVVPVVNSRFTDA